MVKISVILPVYNEERYLEQCLNSICGQTLKEIEIICIDDGSTDQSLNILKKYEKQDSRVKIISQQNLYAGVARNQGMKYATGKYLSFLDSDDFFELDMLERMFQTAEKNDADVTICRYSEYCEKTVTVNLLNWSFEDLFFNTKESFSGDSLNCAGIFQITKGWAWDKLFRAEFVRKCGYSFSDFRSSEDGFFVYMLMARAERISYMDDVFVYHRVNNERSLSNTKESDWMNGFKMWHMIGRELKSQGLYHIYEKSLINELSYFIMWYIDSMNRMEIVYKCKKYIREKVEPEFRIYEYGREMFFQEEVYDWYCELLFRE